MPPMMLDKPPAQPPEISAQGAPAFAGVGAKMAADQKPQGGAGPAVAAWEAVQKVFENMAKMSPQLAPFIARATAIMKTGLEQVASSSPSAPQPGGSPETAKPPEGGSAPGFPG